MTIRSSKGFSLIELLVVVAIIGILAAVGTVTYNGYSQSAMKSATEAAMQQIALAQTEEFSNTSRYYFTPGDEGQDECDPDADGLGLISSALFDETGTLDDSLDYHFCIFGEGNTFTIFAEQSTGDDNEKCQITLVRNGTPQREKVNGEEC